MKAPGRVCPAPGCGIRIEYGKQYCQRHKGLAGRRYDENRPTASARGYDNRWGKARKTWLQGHPLCAECERQGRVRAAVLVDHIMPHKGSQELFWDTDNWQSLCRACHDEKTKREMGNDNHIPMLKAEPKRKIIIVCGPPGAGKSYYVDRHKGRTDEIIDLDHIKVELTGARMYQASIDFLGIALEERNRRIIEAAGQQGGTLWVIVCAGKQEEREAWKARLRAQEVVVLDTPAEECKKRIMDDLRRGDKRMEHCRAVNRWWKNHEASKAITIEA